MWFAKSQVVENASISQRARLWPTILRRLTLHMIPSVDELAAETVLPAWWMTEIDIFLPQVG